MESYIIRLYRREEATGNIVGIVEEIGVEGQRAFKDINELWDILSGKKKRAPLKRNKNSHYGKTKI